MGRILAIDYGRKRTGLAVTDPLKIIANGLTCVETSKLFDFIKQYMEKESVECIVMGKPTKVTGEDSETMKYITPFVNRMRKAYPELPIEMVDERFTTKIAFQAMIDGGLKKSDRNNKNGTVDMVSATIILQTYMESNLRM
ncbi:MAG: Holliday junction resolvase RuvX [Bacteroidales bacterium]|nr:Holliday junction resolvase RuvX [Bacteroidales bacterium]